MRTFGVNEVVAPGIEGAEGFEQGHDVTWSNTDVRKGAEREEKEVENKTLVRRDFFFIIGAAGLSS